MNARALTGWTRITAVAVLLAGALLPTFPAVAQGLAPIPELSSPVTDATGTLAPDQLAALDAKLRAFAQTKGSQVAVLIVPTTQPEDIAQYGIRVVEKWKLGRKGVDDGVLLIVALEDRRMRIEVGYGLEGALPDATANRIIQQDIAPAFKRGDIYGGVNTGVDRIMRVIEGEALPEPEINSPAQGIPGLFNLLPFLLIFAFVGGTILRAIFGRVLGAVATGGLVGFVTWLIISLFGLSVVAGVLAFVISLVSGMGGGPRGGGWYSRRHGSGWGYPGGFGGGFGGGGGGFGGGGFSGGGGGFGGGGASGGW